MDLLKWIGKTFARFVGLLIAVLGAWIFGANAYSAITGSTVYDPGWVLAVVLVAGALSTAGGVLFLLSLDGPERFSTRKTRLRAIVMMIAGSLLPTTVTIVVLPLALLMLTTLKGLPREEPATSG